MKIPIFEEQRYKPQYQYTLVDKDKVVELEENARKAVDRALRKHGKKTGTQLSKFSHELPAWRHSEPNEPIYLPELCVKDEHLINSESNVELIDLDPNRPNDFTPS